MVLRRTRRAIFIDRGAPALQFDDRDAAGELPFNAIGLVDGRMLFVTYTTRGDVVRIISAGGAHEKRNITKFKLSLKKPPKSDWRAFDAMSEAQRHRAALSDPDAPAATAEQLARARRVPSVRALRKKLKLTQEQFASRFHLPLGTFAIGSKAHTGRTRRPKSC